MLAEERFNERYNYYAEKIALVAMEHDILMPGEEYDFTSYVRGC